MVDTSTRDEDNEFIVISDSDSDLTRREAELGQLKMKLRPHRKTPGKFMDNEFTKIQKENENLKAECASQKAEIEKLQMALKRLQSQGNNKELIVIESRSSANVKLHAATIKIEMREEKINRKCDPLLLPDTKLISVLVKTEDSPDEIKHVSCTKSEDGKSDHWNLDDFDLGPPIKIEDTFSAGFSRKVISDALGGAMMGCFHNWRSSDETKVPYVTFNRSWNPQLPTKPGEHGVVFASFSYAAPLTSSDRQRIDFIVGERANYWQYCGTYEVTRTGAIMPAHLNMLSPSVLSTWVKGVRGSQWGKAWLRQINEELVEQAENTGIKADLVDDTTDDGVRAGLLDGRITMSFTIMKCVGYRTDWHENFLRYQAHPKPPKHSNKRKGTVNVKGLPSAKKSKGRSGRRVINHSDTSDSDPKDELDSEDEPLPYGLRI